MICAEEKTVRLGPYTEVEVGCGLKEDQHLGSHFTSQEADGVIVRFIWPGEFKKPKEEKDA